MIKTCQISYYGSKVGLQYILYMCRQDVTFIGACRSPNEVVLGLTLLERLVHIFGIVSQVLAFAAYKNVIPYNAELAMYSLQYARGRKVCICVIL